MIKKSFKKLICLLTLVALITANFAEVSLLEPEPPPPPPLNGLRNPYVISPYVDIDWETVGRYKAGIHNHSNLSDGLNTIEEMLEEAKKRNFDIFSFNNHDILFSAKDIAALSETYGMLLLPDTNEHTKQIPRDHINSYWSNYVCTRAAGTTDVEKMRHILSVVQRRGGISIINHPSRAIIMNEFMDVEKYVELYRDFNSLIGMEIVNRVDIDGEINREVWDSVLALTMPDRPVWGFSNDDAHHIDHLAHSYNVMLINEADELTEDAVRESMENGTFIPYSRFEFGGAPLPEIVSITSCSSKISLKATGYSQINWIVNGEVVSHGSVFNLGVRYNKDKPFNYVRAEIINNSGVVYTQPFGIGLCCIIEEGSDNTDCEVCGVCDCPEPEPVTTVTVTSTEPIETDTSHETTEQTQAKSPPAGSPNVSRTYVFIVIALSIAAIVVVVLTADRIIKVAKSMREEEEEETTD